MTKCRKSFEAAYPGLTENAPQWIQWQVAWDAALMEAATTCDEIGGRYWREYKTGRGPSRANPHVDGKSDGAFECEKAILALRSTASEGG